MSNTNHCECPKWETCEYGEVMMWDYTPYKACCYCIKTEELRGCDIENCNKYKARKTPRKDSWYKNYKMG